MFALWPYLFMSVTVRARPAVAMAFISRGARLKFRELHD